ERRAALLVVVEGEHANASRLAVPPKPKPQSVRLPRGVPERFGDRLSIAERPRTEERKREVQVLGRHDPSRRQLARLPACDAVEIVAGEPEPAEEAEPFIAVHASGEGVTCPSRFRDERAHQMEGRRCGAASNRLAVAGDHEVLYPVAARPGGA